MSCDERLLDRVPLFAGLPAPVRAALAQVATERVSGAGELILLGGEPCEAAYFVIEGAVRIFRDSLSGRQQVLTTAVRGTPFNLVPALRTGGANHASAEAVVASRLLQISSHDLRRLIRLYPDLGLTLLDDLAGKLDHLTDLVETISLRSVRGRLARFLLDNAEKDQVPRRVWTQDEIAARLGTVRDVIGRGLRALVDAGLIQLDRERIIVVDREGLVAESNL
jgi:CRP/FNR family transcriptional regulator